MGASVISWIASWPDARASKTSLTDVAVFLAGEGTFMPFLRSFG